MIQKNYKRIASTIEGEKFCFFACGNVYEPCVSSDNRSVEEIVNEGDFEYLDLHQGKRYDSIFNNMNESLNSQKSYSKKD